MKKSTIHLLVYILVMLFMAAGASWFFVEFFRVFGGLLK